MTDAARPPHRDRRLLAAILVIAAAARFWGIWFGLPLTQARPDESIINAVAVRFFSGDLHPHFFDYPTLFMQLLAVFYWGYYLLGRAAGWFFSVPHFMAQWDQAWSAFYLIGRCFSAVLGTATVAVVYRIADRLFGARCAQVASLFLALSFLHARDSHFGTTDVPVTLLISASMLAILAADRSRDSRQIFVAGLLAGLAASLKYNAVLIGVPVVVGSLVRLKPDTTDAGGPVRLQPDVTDARSSVRPKADSTDMISVVSGFSRTLLTRLLLFAGGFVPAFLLGAPYALLDPHGLLEGFRRVSAHLEAGHGIDLGPGWLYHLTVSLRYGVGWPVLIAALIGIVLSVRRDWRTALVVWSFPIACYVAAGSGRTVFIRYVMPVVPFLCIAAALTVDVIARRVAELSRTPARLQPVVVTMLALLVILPSAFNVVRADVLLGRADNRLLVTDWLRQRVARGASVYQSDTSYGRLELEDPGHRPWYDAWEFDGPRGTFVRADVPQAGGPEWIVIQRSPLLLYSRVPGPVEAMLARGDYVRVRSFVATDMGSRGNVFDQQDAFFLPIAGFHGVRRPGPNFDVYQRRSGRAAVP